MPGTVARARRRIGSQVMKTNKTKEWEGVLSIAVAGLLIALVLCMAIPVGASAASPTVMITDYTVTPSVLAPGGYATISVMLTNTAGTASTTESTGISPGGQVLNTKNVDISTVIDSVELMGNGVTVVDGNYQHFGAIGPGQSVNVTFSIRAPDREGLYFPEVWVGIDGGKNVRYPVPVNVNTDQYIMKTPTVIVTREMPESINPGDSFPVNLTFTNAGVIRVSDLVVTSSTSTTSLGSMGPNTLTLSPLNGGENQTLQLTFITDRDIPLGLQKIALSIDYKLPDGTLKHQDEIIQVPVKGAAELHVASITTEPKTITDGDDVTLIIRLENTGTDTAKSVSAAITLPMDGSKEAFIGKIQPNNDAPAIFSFKANGAGDHEYTLTTSYLDEWGTHNDSKTLRLPVKQADPTPAIAIIAIIAAAVLGAFLYIRKRRG